MFNESTIKEKIEKISSNENVFISIILSIVYNEFQIII